MTTKMKKLFSLATSLCFLTSFAISQEYELFEIENEVPNATFGWDLFNIEDGYAGPHGSSLDSNGAIISVDPGGGFVTSTGNLYAFETLPKYTFSLNSLSTDQPVLNIALQVATTDPAVTAVDIDPMPTEFINLGVKTVLGGFDVYYYWIEWSGLPASTTFEATMTGFIPHVSFAGTRASYYNTATPLDITFGKTVLLGDVNCDGAVNLLDVEPFVDAVSSGEYNEKADMNQDGSVNLLDVGFFVQTLAG